MRKLKLTLAYDGRPWSGWQSQHNSVAIQAQLEKALLKITGQEVIVRGSGRTDAGVHARGQIAHVEVGNTDWTGETWVRAMNANLPASIRVLQCEEASPEFHARFNAIGKIYEYRIWRGQVMSPFEGGLAWHVYGEMNMPLLREGAALFRGTYNFARLSANRGDITDVERRANAEGLTRTLHRLDVFEEGDILRLEFEGDGFLYKMVRMMVGSLVHAARGRADVQWLRSLVADPRGEKSNHCAPADGLCLIRVLYPTP